MSLKDQIKQYQGLTKNQKHAISAAIELQSYLGLKSDLNFFEISNAPPFSASKLHWPTDKLVKPRTPCRIHFPKNTVFHTAEHDVGINTFHLLTQTFAIKNCLSLQECSILIWKIN